MGDAHDNKRLRLLTNSAVGTAVKNSWRQGILNSFSAHAINLWVVVLEWPALALEHGVYTLRSALSILPIGLMSAPKFDVSIGFKIDMRK